MNCSSIEKKKIFLNFGNCTQHNELIEFICDSCKEEKFVCPKCLVHHQNHKLLTTLDYMGRLCQKLREETKFEPIIAEELKRYCVNISEKREKFEGYIISLKEFLLELEEEQQIYDLLHQILGKSFFQIQKSLSEFELSPEFLKSLEKKYQKIKKLNIHRPEEVSKKIKRMSQLLDKEVLKIGKKIEKFKLEIVQMNSFFEIEEQVLQQIFSIQNLDIYDEEIVDIFKLSQSEYFDGMTIVGNAMRNQGFNKLFQLGGDKWKRLKIIIIHDNSLNEDEAVEKIIELKLPQLKKVKVGKNQKTVSAEMSNKFKISYPEAILQSQ